MTIQLPKTIESERIILSVPLDPSFELAKEIYEEVDFSREDLLKFLPWPKTTTKPEHYFLYLATSCDQGYKDGTKFAYVIRHKNTGKFLGIVDLMKVDNVHRSAEIGYWLSSRATGNGYMTEAVRALEKAAFENGVNRIIIRNATTNKPSANVARNAGYILEGVMREAHVAVDSDELLDTNLWSKLKSDWEKEQK